MKSNKTLMSILTVFLIAYATPIYNQQPMPKERGFELNKFTLYRPLRFGKKIIREVYGTSKIFDTNMNGTADTVFVYLKCGGVDQQEAFAVFNLWDFTLLLDIKQDRFVDMALKTRGNRQPFEDKPLCIYVARQNSLEKKLYS